MTDRKAWVSTIIMLVVFLGGVLIAAYTASSEDIWHQLRKITWGQMILLLALSLVNYLFRAARWLLHARAFEIPLNFFQVLRHYFGGFALTLTPGRVGEAIRLRWIYKETGTPLETAAPLILVDRAADMAAIGLVMAACFWVNPMQITGGATVTIVCLALAIILTRPALMTFLVEMLWSLLGRMPRRFARARRAARQMAPFSKASVLIPSLGLGIIGWVAEGYAFYLLLDWMGAPLPLAACIAIFLFASVSGGLTGVPGGVGGAEVVMIGILASLSVGPEVGIPATAIIRITTLWFAVILGLIIFPIAEAKARAGSNALENE